MALRFKVLERFSEEARRKIAERVFNRPLYGKNGRYYACEQGDCIMAALLHAEGIPLRAQDPKYTIVARKLGVKGDERGEIADIIAMNDNGYLDTPEAVRALLLGDDE